MLYCILRLGGLALSRAREGEHKQRSRRVVIVDRLPSASWQSATDYVYRPYATRPAHNHPATTQLKNSPTRRLALPRGNRCIAVV